MKIAFDLDDTLLAEQFPAETGSLPARLLFHETLRRGTRELFRTLRNDGHDIWIYTTSCRGKSYIRWFFRVCGLRLDGVVNQDIHRRQAHVRASKYPPAFGIDVLVDDSRGVELEGIRHGFPTVFVEPGDRNWVQTVLTGIKDLESKFRKGYSLKAAAILPPAIGRNHHLRSMNHMRLGLPSMTR